jgi:hypothetical protein
MSHCSHEVQGIWVRLAIKSEIQAIPKLPSPHIRVSRKFIGLE